MHTDTSLNIKPEICYNTKYVVRNNLLRFPLIEIWYFTFGAKFNVKIRFHRKRNMNNELFIFHTKFSFTRAVSIDFLSHAPSHPRPSSPFFLFPFYSFSFPLAFPAFCLFPCRGSQTEGIHKSFERRCWVNISCFKHWFGWLFTVWVGSFKHYK